jgi:hypothetical protein
VPFTGADSLPPGGGSHRTPAYPPPSRNGYPGRGPAARPGSRARLLEGAVSSPARPGPAHTPFGYDHIRPGPARSGACDPAQFFGWHPGPPHRHPSFARYQVCSGVVRAARGTARSPRRLADVTRVPPGQPGRLAELPVAGATRRHVRRLASPAPWPPHPRHPVPWWAVVSAGLSPVLATGGWLIADAVQPTSYSPIRKTVSVLAGHAGTDRWIVTGACSWWAAVSS